jgi:hypothetical protein
VYLNIVRTYGLETGISAEVNGLCVQSLRATAATNALSHEVDIAKNSERADSVRNYPSATEEEIVRLTFRKSRNDHEVGATAGQASGRRNCGTKWRRT